MSLRRGIDLAASVDSTFGVVLGEQRLGLLETALGRYDDAHQRLRLALQVALASGNPMVLEHSPTRLFTTLARNRLEAGDVDAAATYLKQGLAAQAEVVAQGFGECVTCDVLLYPAAVAVNLARGEYDEAERACQRAEESTTWFHSRAWIATAHELRGLLSHACGHEQPARHHLDRALSVFRTLEQPYDEARCLEALATLTQDRSHARELRDQALQRYRQLGAAGALRRLTITAHSGRETG